MSYPINIDIENKVCVVVGGGHVAFRKIAGLLAAKAAIIVIAQEICNEIQKLLNAKLIQWLPKNYTIGCLPEGMMLIAATDDSKINNLAAIEASTKNMLVNVVTESSNNHAISFSVPSTVRRGDLLLTVSTNGVSPAFSKLIRKYLEGQFDKNFDQWLEKLAVIRDKVKVVITNVNERENFWRNVMSDDIFYLVQNGELDKAEVKICDALNGYRTKS